MKNIATAGVLLAGISAFSSVCFARMPGGDESQMIAKPTQVALVAPSGAPQKPMSNETLIHLHRAVTGIHFLPSAYSATTARCCEPTRASR